MMMKIKNIRKGGMKAHEGWRRVMKAQEGWWGGDAEIEKIIDISD